jgi:SAM-dependent methyltransferase
MAEYGPATYGDQVAAVYDLWHQDQLDTAGAVERLAELAGGGPVLELGIGTGRLALPLAAKGLAVEGIEASTAMLGELRAKPGGASIPVTLADFTEVPVAGCNRLVFAAFNTLLALPSQDAQVRCFRAVAEHLTRDGCWVVEALVPDLSRFASRQTSSVTRVEAGGVVVAAARIDPVEQLLFEQQLLLTDEGIRLYPLQLRYAWPAELDLMARLAGLRLEARWADWRGSLFDAASAQHVSVYRHDHSVG